MREEGGRDLCQKDRSRRHTRAQQPVGDLRVRAGQGHEALREPVQRVCRKRSDEGVRAHGRATHLVPVHDELEVRREALGEHERVQIVGPPVRPERQQHLRLVHVHLQPRDALSLAPHRGEHLTAQPELLLQRLLRRHSDVEVVRQSLDRGSRQ